jgi:hypothetical protein
LSGSMFALLMGVEGHLTGGMRLNLRRNNPVVDIVSILPRRGCLIPGTFSS